MLCMKSSFSLAFEAHCLRLNKECRTRVTIAHHESSKNCEIVKTGQAEQYFRVMITQIIRMVYSYDPRGGTILSLAKFSVWTGLHLGFSIICACLPVFRVFLPKDNGIINTALRMLYKTVTTRFNRTSSNSPTDHNGPSLPSFVRPYKQTGLGIQSRDQLPLTGISVVSEVEVLGVAEYHLRQSDKPL